MALIALLIILIILAIILILGFPIAIAIALSSITSILPTLDPSITMVTAAQRIFAGMSNFTLIAIPFFILAGNIMNQGGIAKRLVDFALAIVGKVPGSLIHTNIVANAFFGAISGSAAAAAAAVGSMVKEQEEKLGYDMDFATASNGATAPTGLLIPPSNALITYSLVSGGTSVAALFMAGYIPGILWSILCMIAAAFMIKRKGYKSNAKFSFTNLVDKTLKALPALSLIFIVIGGIVAGIFTATEGSAICVAYALVLSIIYRTMSFKKLYKILIQSAMMSGVVVFLIGVSSIMSWVMAFLGIPQAISALLLSITSNQYALLLIINIILLLAGTFMDVTPAILIFTPIFLPIVKTLGIHPVHFGIILVYNLCIGNITPPVGNTLFVAIKVGNTTLAKVLPYVLKYYLAIIIGLLLITYIPSISMILPQLAGLIK